MTGHHPVRRALARICSAGTMARVVDPTLADMRFEDGRPTWRGCLALARALTLHGVASLPGVASRLWRDDDHALPRAVGAGTVMTLMLVALLVLPPVADIPADQRLGPFRTIILLAPQALGIALPASLLVAIPVAFRGVAERRRAIVRGLVLSVVCAAATFVVINWIMPDANQMWREEVSAHVGGPVRIDRGPNELPLHELRELIERRRLMPGEVRAARTLEHTYHLRLMLGMLAVPLGIFGVAMALSVRGRIRSVLAGVGATIAYAGGLFPLEYAVSRLTMRFEAIPPAVAVWAPAVALVIVSSIALRRSLREASTPTAA